MPRNTLGPLPFHLVKVDTDASVTAGQITALFGNGRAISICVRSRNGPQNRGGYFFHIERVGDMFRLNDFEKNVIADLTSSDLTRFINHACGHQFDEEMLRFSQQVVNLRQDQTDPE